MDLKNKWKCCTQLLIIVRSTTSVIIHSGINVHLLHIFDITFEIFPRYDQEEKREVIIAIFISRKCVLEKR